MGSAIAREIEEKLHLPHGWMDQDHSIASAPKIEKKELGSGRCCRLVRLSVSELFVGKKTNPSSGRRGGAARLLPQPAGVRATTRSAPKSSRRSSSRVRDLSLFYNKKVRKPSRKARAPSCGREAAGGRLPARALVRTCASGPRPPRCPAACFSRSACPCSSPSRSSASRSPPSRGPCPRPPGPSGPR